ncbi:MAG: DUF4440 domain-containing protein [Planctomycetia bacterium]|nr:DUF4440 domain-containing protein [Planctomycetia bacterium]
MDAAAQEIVTLTQRLLDSIAKADWKTYAELCDASISCFEPEARGHLVEGMPFHEYYFKLGADPNPRTTTLAQPHVRLLGADAAVIAYSRLVQKLDGAGGPTVAFSQETRVWQKKDGRWKHVHFHRSVE